MNRTDKIVNTVAALAGSTGVVAPMAGALPDGTPPWAQVAVQVLGLALALVTGFLRLRGSKAP